MTLAEYCELLHVGPENEPSDEVVLAASYLQAKGLGFCSHFGFENAVKIAEEMYQAEMSKK